MTPRAGRGGGAGRAAKAEQAMGSKMGMGFAASALAMAAAVGSEMHFTCHDAIIRAMLARAMERDGADPKNRHGGGRRWRRRHRWRAIPCKGGSTTPVFVLPVVVGGPFGGRSHGFGSDFVGAGARSEAVLCC